jgi:hypothetical protein
VWQAFWSDKTLKQPKLAQLDKVQYKTKHFEGKTVTKPMITEKAKSFYYEIKIADLPVKNSDLYRYCRYSKTFDSLAPVWSHLCQIIGILLYVLSLSLQSNKPNTYTHTHTHTHKDMYNQHKSILLLSLLPTTCFSCKQPSTGRQINYT